MSGKNGLLNVRPRMVYFLVFSLCAVTSIWAQNWERLELDGGGVAEDVQLVYHDSTNDSWDQVWSACANGGLFRNTYSSGWGSWTGYNYGTHFRGVDAIEVNGTEYVISAGHEGLRYDASSFSTSLWPRPTSSYPSNWNFAFTHDAAFYWPDSGEMPDDPEGQYFVILSASAPNSNPEQKPGIYRWVGSPTNNFSRVDAQYSYSNPKYFSEFYRDIKYPNVIYAIGREHGDTPGGLYMISGDYSTPTWDTVAFNVGQNTYYAADVFGFSQHTYGSEVVYTYVLIKYYVSDQPVYSVFTTNDLPTQSDPTWQEVCLYSTGREITVFNPTAMAATCDIRIAEFSTQFGGVVGKPYYSGGLVQHRQWIATGAAGIWCYDTGENEWHQVNGTSPQWAVDLKRWGSFSLIPDIDHLGAGDDMRLLMGTHQAGVWYLDYNTGGTYDWDHLRDGFYGTEIRGLTLVEDDGEILAPAFLYGLWRGEANNQNPSWTELGIGTTPYITNDLQFNRGITCAVKFNGDYYTGSYDGVVYVGYDSPDDLSKVYLGGLYGVDDTTNYSYSVGFFPGISNDSSKVFAVSDLATTANRMYLSTGFFGTDDINAEVHAICQYHQPQSAWQWDTLYTSKSEGAHDYTDLGLLEIEPDALKPDSALYIAVGNIYGMTGPVNPGANYAGRLEYLKQVGNNNWDIQSNIWESASNSNYSVYDVSNIEDPYMEGKSLLVWGVGKFSSQGSATAGLQRGCVYLRHWNGSQYENDNLYATSGNVTLDNKTYEYPPACSALKFYLHNGQAHIVAFITGEIQNPSSDEPAGQSHLYDCLIDYNYRPHWYHLGTPVPLGGNQNVYLADIRQICVDPNNGYDVYVGGQGGVFWQNNTYLDKAISSGGWQWVSFNVISPEDSLQYMFATQDSIEEIKDQYGDKYRPYDNPPLDEIATWNWLKGYSVKTYVADTLRVFGEAIPYDSAMMLYPAPVDSSWIYNCIAYLPDDTLNVNDAFLPDSDYVIIVKEDGGNFWKPGDGDDFNMVPGEGYQVGVTDTLEYVYPDPQQFQSIGPIVKLVGPSGTQSLTPAHFQFTVKTGDFYPIYIEDLLVNGQPPESEDEVGCFTLEGLCVGAAIFEGEFPLKIAAWKDDLCTEEMDGYTPGQTLSFKFFDVSAGLEIPLEMTMVATQALTPQLTHAYTTFGQGFYAEHRLQASYVLPQCYNLAQNYPNPFNPTTTIRYDLPFESIVHLDIFDLMGRKVATLVDGKQSAGFRAIYWKGENNFGAQVSSGVYFYRLKTEATHEYLGKKESFEKTRKMVMIK